MADDSNKKIKINSKLCTRCGTCVAVHPEIFGFADDGSVKVKEDADLTGKDLEEVKNVCPAGAIDVS